VKWYRKAAEQGDASAQHYLGLMYEKGKGIKKSDVYAFQWFNIAASNGDKTAKAYRDKTARRLSSAQINAAMNKLGVMYSKGDGVVQDYKEAAKLYRKAAEQGVATAQYNLGKMYIDGKGVEKDYKEAAKWFCKAAEKGDEKHIKGCLDFVGRGSVETQFKLGKMFQQGQGVAQDDNKAARWICGAAEKGLSEARKSCRKIASSGNAAAQYRLGLLLREGKGILQDTVTAHMWLNIASANGWSDAVRQRDKIAKLLSVEQREKSAERAKRCMGSDYKDCEAQAKSWWQKITR
jgi:TPR repeat protein